MIDQMGDRFQVVNCYKLHAIFFTFLTTVILPSISSPIQLISNLKKFSEILSGIVLAIFFG